MAWAKAGIDSKFQVSAYNEVFILFLDRMVIEFIDEMER